MYFKPTEIQIGTLNVNNADHMSSISMSSTFKFNRNVNGKKNQAVGQQHADGCLRWDSISMLLDDDALDSPSLMTTPSPSQQGG